MVHLLYMEAAAPSARSWRASDRAVGAARPGGLPRPRRRLPPASPPPCPLPQWRGPTRGVDLGRPRWGRGDARRRPGSSRHVSRPGAGRGNAGHRRAGGAGSGGETRRDVAGVRARRTHVGAPCGAPRAVCGARARLPRRLARRARARRVSRAARAAPVVARSGVGAGIWSAVVARRPRSGVRSAGARSARGGERARRADARHHCARSPARAAARRRRSGRRWCSRGVSRISGRRRGRARPGATGSRPSGRSSPARRRRTSSTCPTRRLPRRPRRRWRISSSPLPAPRARREPSLGGGQRRRRPRRPAPDRLRSPWTSARPARLHGQRCRGSWMRSRAGTCGRPSSWWGATPPRMPPCSANWRAPVTKWRVIP